MKRLLALALVAASLAFSALEALHSHPLTQSQPCATCSAVEGAAAAPATQAPRLLADSGWTAHRTSVAALDRDAVSLLPRSRGPPRS